MISASFHRASGGLSSVIGRYILAMLCLVSGVSILMAQEFSCDGTFYMVVYKDAEGVSKLYEIIPDGDKYGFYETILSENRRLTGLAFNVSDMHLWALDVDNLEMVRINSTGNVEPMGEVRNLDPTLRYQSGMMSPKGDAYYFMGFNEQLNSDSKLYKFNLDSDSYEVSFEDIPGQNFSRIQDLGVDPVYGTIYALNNLDGTVAQLGIDGQISTVSQFPNGEQYIDALFFDREGLMYGYTPSGELYEIDKIDGSLRLIQRGPQGTDVDGCACPYTYTFTKTVIPGSILPCESFSVRYDFVNHLGISQTEVMIADTFPTGFEIIDISASFVFTPVVPPPPSNVLALENMIYVMGANDITITVQPSPGFFGAFASQAFQQPFPVALDRVHSSDDPSTEVPRDATSAIIVNEDQVDLYESFFFDCLGNTATLVAPVEGVKYAWSTGENTKEIRVTDPGVYILEMSADCFFSRDSVQIDSFPGENSVTLGQDISIIVGDPVEVEVNLQRGQITSITWLVNGVEVDCENCSSIVLNPEIPSTVEVFVIDEDGCTYEDRTFIDVAYEKSIYVPTAFSPNGDGVNDVFYVSSSIPGAMNIYVYNRWGNLVYEGLDMPLSISNGGWNGTFDGKQLGSGTFIWVAELFFVDGSEDKLSGSVLLISD